MATETDNTSTGVIATIVVVGSFAMIAISAMVAAMVRSEDAELERVRPSNADLETVAQLVEKQRARLNAPPSWVGEPGGKVAIPIATAMRLVIDEYQKDPLAASPPPPPGLVMETAPAAVPGPGALPSNLAPSGAAPPAGVPPSAPSTTVPTSPAAPSALPPGTPSNTAPAKPAPPSEAPAMPAPPSAVPPSTPAEPALPSAPSNVPQSTPPSKVEPVAPTSVGGP